MIVGLLGRRTPRTATEWFAARHRSRSPALERQFEQWIAADRAHAEQYALCEILWEVSGPAAKDHAKRAGAPNGRSWNRAMLPWIATVATIAGAAGLALWVAPAGQSFETGPGEQRTLVLADGSRVTLNTRSRIEVSYGHRARLVMLDDGEAFFDVAKDPDRPFTVRTRLGSARAVGTHFDVYLSQDRLAVTTQEGTVLVSDAKARSAVLVAAGRQAALTPGMARASVTATDVDRTVGWLRQRLEVDNQPLGEVLAEFSRYTSIPVRPEDASVAALRVSAVLRTGDMEALAATLKGALGLQLVRRNESLLVARGDGAAPVSRP